MAERTARTRRERVEAREGEIVAAASHLFAERDIDDVTVGEIGRRAGVAEGTVYLYFESKAALVQAVVVAFYERLTAHAADGVRRIRDTRKRLEFLAEHHVTNVIEHRHILFAVPRKRLDDGDGNEYRLNRTYVAVFDDVIREGVDRGEIRADVPTWLLRDIFYGSLEYAARTTMIHGRAQDARRAVQGLLQALDDGIMTSETTRALDGDATVEKVAARLERVADRLEATVPATGSRKPKR